MELLKVNRKEKNLVRFATVKSKRIGRKNITQIDELWIDKNDFFEQICKELGSKNIEVRRGKFCNLILSEEDESEMEFIHTFVLEGNDVENTFIPGDFIIAGAVNKGGTFEGLDKNIDKEWIDNRILVTVFTGKKEKN